MAKRILITDDAAFMRMMLKDILTKGGYEIAGEAVEGWGNFFGFLCFIGKIALLLAAFVVKVKYEKTGIIAE